RTRLIRGATRRPSSRRIVNPPIERGTTLLNARAADLHDASRGPTYGIDGAGVHRALEQAMAELEGARQVFLVPTGLASVTVAAMAVLRPGDEILVVDAVYGPTRRFFEREMKRWSVGVRFYPAGAGPAEILALAGSATRAVLIESPASLTFEMTDVAALASGARERGLVSLMDNTWAAGALYKPLDHGVDISVQALSKYVGGHSDVFLGSIATNGDTHARRLSAVIEDLGWYVSPDDAWLALRGLRTLPVRLAQHERGARQVAEWLERQPQVQRVLWPALPSFDGHHLWKRDYVGASGLMGVVLANGPAAAAEALLDRLDLFGLGFSWGGFESLATFETPQLARRRHQQDLGGPLVRLHIGLEAPEDLIADLEQALAPYP
ncbi:MAG TPA: cystathionine beta-lyase, partial [Caulobacteraceae bacterium]|nr:cystathionine beta-lyase [Caulobacteraceae bacterium]